MLGGAFEDTSLPWETQARMLDNLMVSLAGSSAERQSSGEHTNGLESDYDTAVSIGMRIVKAGFGGPGLFVGEDGLPHMYLSRRSRLGRSCASRNWWPRPRSGLTRSSPRTRPR